MASPRNVFRWRPGDRFWAVRGPEVREAQAAGWTFTTRTSGPTGADVLVDADGTAADFRSVQGALNYVMATVDTDTPVKITINDGVYRELLYVRGKNNLTLVGQSRDGVVIEYENYEGFNPGTGSGSDSLAVVAGGGRSLFLVESCDLLTLESLTLRSLHGRTGSGDQAETIYFNNNSGRLIAKNVRFQSEQDTLQLKGYSWLYQSLVEGNVDFIWGANQVPVGLLQPRADIRRAWRWFRVGPQPVDP